MTALKLGFLASNNGSSMRAIVAASADGRLNAEARLVISNKRNAGALEFARGAGLPARLIPTLPDPVAADRAMADALIEAGVTLVILSGYLRQIGGACLAAFPGRILNIHPALLPLHGGRGFYGRRIHEAVAASGARASGITIHVVDSIYDHGAIIAQRIVPLAPGDGADAIERKVTAEEPGFFVETLEKIASRALVLDGC